MNKKLLLIFIIALVMIGGLTLLLRTVSRKSSSPQQSLSTSALSTTTPNQGLKQPLTLVPNCEPLKPLAKVKAYHPARQQPSSRLTPGRIPPQQSATTPAATVPYIDTHTHLQGGPGAGAPSADQVLSWAAQATASMSDHGITRAMVMPPPAPKSNANDDYTNLLAAAAIHPNQLVVLAGGGSLNPIITQTTPESLTDTTRCEFQILATDIIEAGAVGFGEMAALHLSFTDQHPFIQNRPNHPLFLLLADISAYYQVPIDLHMEAVPKNIATPDRFKNDANPVELTENIRELEELLDHNTDAKIVWTHIGWDNTGEMTVDLLRRLLTAHANLFLAIKIDTKSPTARSEFPQNSPLNENNVLRPTWQALFEEFPTRFVVGSDALFGIEQQTNLASDQLMTFLQTLPQDLQTKIASENAKQLYRFDDD